VNLPVAYYLAWPNGQIWPNLLASAICSGIIWWRLHRRSVIHHAEQLALIARLHLERLDQADRHADEIKRQLTAHCGDLKSHVTAVGSHMASAIAVPQQLLDDIKKAPRGGERM